MPIPRPVRAALASALLAGCTIVNGTQIPAPQAEAVSGGKLLAIRQTYTGTVPFLGRDMPLPIGTWTALQRRAAQFRDDSPPLDEVVLLRHDGPVLTGLLILLGTPVNKAATNGFPLAPTCSGGDVMASSVRRASAFGDQDCVAVNWVRPALWRSSPSPAPRSVAAGLDLVGVAPPPVLVSATIVEADAEHFLSYRLFVNPDRAGIAPDLATRRAESGWAAINLARDPAKKAFADRVLAWAEGWRAIIRQVMAGGSGRVPADLAALP